MAEDQDSFEVLGLRPGASVDSVKEAYRLLGARCLSTCACTALLPARRVSRTHTLPRRARRLSASHARAYVYAQPRNTILTSTLATPLQPSASSA